MIEDGGSASTRIRFWSVVAVTATAYVQSVILCYQPWCTWSGVSILGLSVLYALGCIFGQPWCERQGSDAWNYAYFSIQIVLVSVFLFASPVKGAGVYFLLPLLSQAIFVLRPRAAIAISVLLLAIALAHIALPFGKGTALQYLPAIIAGFVFTAGFSYLMVREIAARHTAVGLSARLEEANARLRDYANQVEELTVTRERNRLAREIHDSLGHYLTAIAVQTEAAGALMTKDPARAATAMDRTRNLAEEALADVHRSIGVLRAGAERAPLRQQLQTLVTSAPGLQVEIETQGEPRDLPLEVEHAVFRTVQEGLTNIRKHAGATQATISMDFTGAERVRVQIVDDGDRKSTSRTGGFGLNGMRERIESLGGRMQAGPRPAGGFELSVDVPA